MDASSMWPYWRPMASPKTPPSPTSSPASSRCTKNLRIRIKICLHSVKTVLLIFCLLIFSLSATVQDKRVYTTHDPAFDYISEYMPEYYYENFEMEKEPRNMANSKMSVDVRVLRNFKDDKTFTYLIVGRGDVHATLFLEEIPSLISYLERVIGLMKMGKKLRGYSSRQKGNNHRPAGYFSI